MAAMGEAADVKPGDAQRGQVGNGGGAGGLVQDKHPGQFAILRKFAGWG